MSEDLQSLLEKINRDGVEKARAESDRILAEAKAKASEIVQSAKEESARIKAEGEKASAASAARAGETIRQAERDTIRKIEASVTALLEKLLAKDVDKALADPEKSAALVTAAIADLTGPGEIACGAELAKSLAARLARLGSFTVVTDATLGTGFSVKLDGGRVEHAFTGEVIADELAKRLRPDLAALLK